MTKLVYHARVLGRRFAIGMAACLAVAATGVSAQVQTVDPNAVIDGDLTPGAMPAQPAQTPPQSPAASPAGAETGSLPALPADAPPPSTTTAPAPSATPPATKAAAGTTYKDDDLIGAAEGVFGKGAKGLAGVIKDILKKQGEPNGYIVGREGGGAIIIGLRYGSGTLYHKVEGQKPVYWTGPSIGLDAGGNVGNTFVLVYNLYNTDDLYHRFGQGEGQAYLVGGFHVSYLRRGDVVLIPVRTGVGLRLGINAGYMKLSKKSKWLPF